MRKLPLSCWALLLLPMLLMTRPAAARRHSKSAAPAQPAARATGSFHAVPLEALPLPPAAPASTAPASTVPASAAAAQAPQAAVAGDTAAVRPESVGLPAPASRPPAALGLRVGAKLGAWLPTSRLNISWVTGVDVAYFLPWWQQRLGVGLELTYAQPAMHGSLTTPATGLVAYRLQQQLFTLAFEAQGHLPVASVDLYAAVGYGLYFLKSYTSAFGQTETSSQVRGGLRLRAGGGYAVGPGQAFAELSWHYAQLRFLSTGASNIGGVGLAGGYRFIW